MYRRKEREGVLGRKALIATSEAPAVVEVGDNTIKDEDRDEPCTREADVPHGHVRLGTFE